MGVKLIREVLDRAPAELSTAERLMLLILAESANDASREAWPGMDVLTHRTGLEPVGVRRVFQRLAARGLEVRVAVGTDAAGRPVFACRGRQTTYRIPVMPRRDAPTEPTRNAGTPVPPSDPEKAVPQSPHSTEKGGTASTQRRYAQSRKAVPPYHPSRQEPSGNRQRLHERDEPNDPDRAAMLAEIRRRRPDASPALIRHIAREDGPDILAEIQARRERERIAAAIAEARKGPACRHGERGGEALHPTSGEPLCAQCRHRKRLASLPVTTPTREAS